MRLSSFGLLLCVLDLARVEPGLDESVQVLIGLIGMKEDIFEKMRTLLAPSGFKPYLQAIGVLGNS